MVNNILITGSNSYLGKEVVKKISTNKYFALDTRKINDPHITPLKNFKDIKYRTIDMLEYISFISKKNVFFSKKTIGLNLNKKEISLNSILGNIENEKKLILKIDIEGTEYDLIEEILENSKKLDLLIIEFHNTDEYDTKFTNSIISLQKFFNIIHLHGNNHCGVGKSGVPEALEITFLNKINELPKNIDKVNFPIKDLDYPNNPNSKDIFFSFD